jgi:hypothetical protein
MGSGNADLGRCVSRLFAWATTLCRAISGLGPVPEFLRWHRLVSNLAQRQKSKVTPARAPESARAFAGLRLRRHLSFDAHHGADADAERLGNLVQTVALA